MLEDIADRLALSNKIKWLYDKVQEHKRSLVKGEPKGKKAEPGALDSDDDETRQDLPKGSEYPATVEYLQSEFINSVLLLQTLVLELTIKL
jgi:hypothetical protein